MARGEGSPQDGWWAAKPGGPRQGNRSQGAPVLIVGTKMNRLLNISKVTSPGPCLPDSKVLCSPISRHNMVAQGLANYSPELNSTPGCELRVFIFLKVCQKKSKMYTQRLKHSLPAFYRKSLLTPALSRGETLMEEPPILGAWVGA